MSVAFRIEVGRSARAAALTLLTGAIPVSGLLLSAASLFNGPNFVLQDSEPGRWLIAAVALLFAAALCASTVRRLPARSNGVPRSCLIVGDDGSMVCSDSGRAPTQVRMRSVCRLPGLIVMTLAPSSDHRVVNSQVITLVLGRDAMPAESWRVLNVWLLWQLRGQSLQQLPGNPTT